MPLRAPIASRRAMSGGASSGGGNTSSVAGSPTSRRKPHANGFTNIGPVHFLVLRWPGPNGQRPVELAQRAGRRAGR